MNSLLEQMESELKTSKHLQGRWEKNLAEIKAEDEEKPDFKGMNAYGRGQYETLIESEMSKQELLDKWISILKRSEGNVSRQIPVTF